MASVVMRRTFVFVFWIISAGVQCAHGPTITDPPGDELLIDKGKNIELTCKGDRPLDWNYPAAAFNTTKKKVSIKPLPYESKFQLRDAEFDDTGYYYCFKKNGKPLNDDKVEKDSIYVFVEDDKQPIILDEDIAKTIVGEPCVIKCRPSSPDFKIELFKESVKQIVTKDGRNDTWRFDPKKGFIKEHMYQKDAGYYSCVFEEVQERVYVLVLGSSSAVPKPRIILSRNEHVAGKSMNLTCIVDVEMYVQVNLTWKVPPGAKRFTVDGLQLKKKSTGFQVTRNLTLHGMQKGESGIYTCNVTNHMGKTNNASATVNVLDPSTTFINFTLHNAVDGCTAVKEGENVTWIIDVNAFPRPNISWHNSHGFPLSDNKKYVITIDKTMQTILHILNARGSDSGLYVLRARNEKMSKEFTPCLLVRSKPVVRLYSPRIKYEPGNLYQINCTAKGYPPATVKWSFKPCENGNVKKCAQPTNLPSSHYTQVRVDNSTVNSTLTITAKESGFVVCQAYNAVGNSPPKDHSFTVTGSESGPNVGMIVGIIIVAILLLVLIGFLIFRIHKEKERRKELEVGGILHFDEGDINLLSKNLPIDEQADLLPYNKQWEFPKEKLKLGKQLGAGAFGLVMKAQAEGIIEGEPVTTVAVKMVKRNAEIMFLKALASELKIMVHLGKHLNVVNLLGACTSNIIKRELYVIVEYCPFGNVHNYLLRHREDFINQVDKETGKIDPTIGEDILAQAEYSFQKLRPKASLVSFSNSGFDSSSVSYHGSGDNSETVSMMPMGETSSGSSSGSAAQPEWRSNYKSDYRGKVRPITTQDLICWSFQIARGMEYLVSRKVMHGDLAARNILLAENNIVKICDFGLAKSIYKSENYKKKGDGPLPIKWMALESIRDRIFSTQSDIWSYGIVLWELFSLAATPYPGMQPNEEFYNKLVSGYRMEKPQYATEDIYQVMSKCWLTNPNERPSFTHLAESMGSFLDSTIRNHYISLNDPYVRMNQQWQQNRSDYLNMLNVPTYNNLVSPLNDESHIYVNSPLSADSSDFSNVDGDSGYLNMSRPTSPFMKTPEVSLPSPKWSALATKRKSTMNDDSESIDLMHHL